MLLRNRLTALIAACGTAFLVACGNALPVLPLQSPVTTPSAAAPTPGPTSAGATQTPIILPTATAGLPAPVNTPAPTSAAATPATQPRTEPTVPPLPTNTPRPTLTPDLTAVFAPPVTPNTKATSFAVLQTVTALAASPTYPPTSVPRPRRQPIVIGSGNAQDRLPATSAAEKQGITVQTISPQVSRGGSAALAVKTTPNAICSLQIARPVDGDRTGTVSFEPIAGSARQSASRDGGVAWIWTVDADEPAGSMTLIIDCGDAGLARAAINVLP